MGFYAGMTVSERLDEARLPDDYAAAALRGDREALLSMLYDVVFTGRSGCYSGIGTPATGILFSSPVHPAGARFPLHLAGSQVRFGCVVLVGQYQPAGFANWSTPEFVVISGSRNVEDIPAIERVKHAYRLRGAEVFQAAEDRCVTFEISSTGQIDVRTFRPHVRATRESIEVPPAISEIASNFSQPE